MKMIPTERAVYMRGHSDGERGHPPQSKQYTGPQLELYERGYRKGFDTRYREDAARKQHGNKRMGFIDQDDAFVAAMRAAGHELTGPSTEPGTERAMFACRPETHAFPKGWAI